MSATRATARRGFRWPRIEGPTAWVVRLLTLATILVAWESFARGVNLIFVAPPSQVASAMVEIAIEKPEVWQALGLSLGTLILGLLLTLPVGIAIGLAMGHSRLIEHALDPYVTFLYVLPGTALIPLLVLWFGIDLELRLALVFLSAVFPLIVNTMAGVRNVDPELLDTAHSFRASEFQKLRTIVFPASIPFIFAGIRIAFSAAWVGVIVAEMTALLAGVGGLISLYANLFKTAHLIVLIVFIMFVGIAVNALMAAIYRILTPWHEA